MFVRQVTAHFKPDKFDLFNQRLENDVIPLLQKQSGFRDELAFFDKDNDEAIAMSFWDSKQDADDYQRDIYPQVSNKMEKAIEGTPEIFDHMRSITQPGTTFTLYESKTVEKWRGRQHWLSPLFHRGLLLARIKVKTVPGVSTITFVISMTPSLLHSFGRR